MILNEIFDKIYLINLEEDKDKLYNIKKKLKKYNIKYEIVKGINGNKLKNIKLLRFGNKGAVGIKKTQMKIIKDAKINNYKKILILEDDLIFKKKFVESLTKQYKELSKIYREWDLLYLGCSYRYKNNDVNKFYVKANGSYGNFAVGVDQNAYDSILKAEDDNRPIDDIFVENIQNNSQFTCLVFNPMVITADVRKLSKTDGIKANVRKYYKINNINLNKYDFKTYNKLNYFKLLFFLILLIIILYSLKI